MPHGKSILAATILGSSMAFIDATAVGVALPVMQRELAGDIAGMQWVVEAYQLFLASLILVGGALGDRFGRTRVFTIGTALFAAASLWCGLAPDLAQLIAARIVQGIGGALLVPGSLAIITASFPRSRRGKAIGTWAAGTSLTLILGPLLGGWLTDQFSWRWIFFINLAVAAAVILLAHFRLPADRPSQKRALDWRGAALATSGLGSLVYGLVESSSRGFGDPLVLSTLAAGFVLLAAFVIVERKIADPMLPMKLFDSSDFAGANMLTLLLYAALQGTLFFLPFNLIQVQGFTAMQAGAANLPMIGTLVLLSRWAGHLADRFGPRKPLIIGPLLAGAGFALLTIPGADARFWITFFPALLVLGVGMGITVAPLTTTVLNAAGSENAGIASGVNNAASRTAGVFAVAIFGIIVVQVFAAGMETRMDAIELSGEPRRHIREHYSRLAELEVPPGVAPDVRARIEKAIEESYVRGFRAAMVAGALLAFAASGCAAWTIEGERRE